LKRHGNPIVVVKIGGSILTNSKAYRQTASFVLERVRETEADRYVVVVSAQNGETDSLERQARRIHPAPRKRALDLLWSTGELRSVAILTMHLQRLGTVATGLNIHETGLGMPVDGDVRQVLVDSSVLLQELLAHRVVVVPGFLATTRTGGIVSLGRGGSDLTAVLLASSLGARRCELIKDVTGYSTSDPHTDASAEHIPSLTYEQALEMADRGCDLVQREAIEAAVRSNLPLVIRSVREKGLATVIGTTTNPFGNRSTIAVAVRRMRDRDTSYEDEFV